MAGPAASAYCCCCVRGVMAGWPAVRWNGRDSELTGPQLRAPRSGVSAGDLPSSPSICVFSAQEFSQQNANIGGVGSVANNASSMGWSWTSGAAYVLIGVPIIPLLSTSSLAPGFFVPGAQVWRK